MKCLKLTLAATIVLLGSAGFLPGEEDANSIDSGRISGMVVDANGTGVGGVVVVLCDQQSGIPLSSKTNKPFTDGFLTGDKSLDVRVSRSNETGEFVFEAMPAGQYRLVGQSWKGVTDFKGVFEKNGEEITLRGIAEHVKVAGAATTEAMIRPLGDCTLRIDEDMPNDETLVLLSRAPTRADPILGFAGWGGAFMANMIGGNRMPDGRTTVHGLPEGKLYIGMFAADSVPGWTQGEVEIKPRVTNVPPYIQFVNAWSNSRHDPPEDLMEVFNEVKEVMSENRSFAVEKLKEVGIDPENSRGMWKFSMAIAKNLDVPVHLPSGVETSFGDLMAAMQYVSLQESVARRKERADRAKASREAKAASGGDAEKGSYAEAFLALYEELGKNYPCFELKGIDWKAVGDELLARVKDVNDDKQFGLLCMELVARLEDSHAQLLKGSAELPQLELPQWDPGFACLEDDAGRVVVYHVDKQGPADLAGIKPGITVTSINGMDANQAIDETMKRLSKYIGYSSERYLRYHAHRFFGRQMARGSIVKLKMVEPDGQNRQFDLPANLKSRYLPRLPVQIEGISDSANVSWKMLDEKIGYIYVRRIRRDLTDSLNKAVGELGDAQGLIVDVRGNSGGGFDAKRSHLNFALDTDEKDPNRPRFVGPMALLIDSRCISAGEGWASWFVANDRARLFGEATAGASARKKTYTLTNGLYRVRYPVKAYRGYLNRPIERKGLVPDVPVKMRAKDIASGKDTVLEAARQYLVEAQ